MPGVSRMVADSKPKSMLADKRGPCPDDVLLGAYLSGIPVIVKGRVKPGYLGGVKLDQLEAGKLLDLRGRRAF
jgi:hypothetical protein